MELLRRNAALLTARRIESLMTVLVARLADVFRGLTLIGKPFALNPAFIGHELCPLPDLYMTIHPSGTTNMAAAYPLWLLTQCRTRIAARYGWCLVLSEKTATRHCLFPGCPGRTTTAS